MLKEKELSYPPGTPAVYKRECERERERKKERERENQREREKERARKKESAKERKRLTERKSERKREKYTVSTCCLHYRKMKKYRQREGGLEQ